MFPVTIDILPVFYLEYSGSPQADVELLTDHHPRVRGFIDAEQTGLGGSALTLTIIGRGHDGEIITEILALPASGRVNGTELFHEVDSIISDTTSSGLVLVFVYLHFGSFLLLCKCI